jgi:hypothetical protein
MTDVSMPAGPPSLVDMDRLGREIDPPAEVSKFAPAKYRMTTPLSQWQNDMRRKLTEARQLIDDALRDIG